MTKAQVFVTIKEANAICDKMAKFSVESAEYAELNSALGYTLDSIMCNGRKDFALLLSKRTGHYYVKF